MVDLAETGTIDTLEKDEEKRSRLGPSPRRPGRRSGGSGGPRGNGGGGGGDRSDSDFESGSEEYQSNKFRIGTGFLLLVVLMTFGGLIGAYVVVSTNAMAEWRPFSLPVAVWVSTFLILAGSVTFEMAHRKLDRGAQSSAKKWLIATTGLGGMFIASQLTAWLMLAGRGVYMESNPYAGFFYLFTALHALHVIGGMIALGYVVLRAWMPTASERELQARQNFSQVVSWYWHFMGALWLVLLMLLGFWR